MRLGDPLCVEDHDAMQPKRLIFTKPSAFPTWMKAVCVVGLAAALALWGVW